MSSFPICDDLGIRLLLTLWLYCPSDFDIICVKLMKEGRECGEGTIPHSSVGAEVVHIPSPHTPLGGLCPKTLLIHKRGMENVICCVWFLKSSVVKSWYFYLQPITDQCFIKYSKTYYIEK